MTVRRSNQRWRRAIDAAALTLSVGLAAGGCNKDPAALGGSPSLTPATTSGSYQLPLDSVPSSDGSTFYFTAMSTSGSMGVFSVPAAGGAATQLFAGAPLSSPFGIAISSDDKTLFIADSGAGYDPNNPGTGAEPDMMGQVLSMPTAGGTPVALTGTTGFRPKGIEVFRKDNADTIYFSGYNASDGKAGVFSVGPDGGGLTPLTTGGPLTDPGGVTVARDGTVYVVNTTATVGGTAEVFKVAGGSAASVVAGIKVGYPAGLAVSQDGNTLLISGQDRDLNTTVVHRYDLASSTLGQTNMGIENNTDAGGLHRAKGGDTFSWCGVTAGTAGGGIVYRVSFN